MGICLYCRIKTSGKIVCFFIASLLQKLTNLITIFIVFGAFIFLIGLCGAFIVGICLYCRIKTSGKIVCFNTSNGIVN